MLSCNIGIYLIKSQSERYTTIIIITIIIIIIMLFHKNRIKQIPVYSIQQHLELKKPVKLVKHVVSFIGKELAEDRRSCHQVPVASIAELNLLIFRNR